MDESSNTTASSVARAILAVLDYNSTPDARKAAVSFLESIKGGDIWVLANTSFLLVKKDWATEIRLNAFKMLQHLVRLRWEELSPPDRRKFANIAVELMSEIANPSEEWALKSQTAAVVAEIVRREGPYLWVELLPSLVSLSNQGPVQAELVLMMLRWLPEDVTVHNEDLEGEKRRLLLRALTQSLPEIFPLLYTLLERHVGAAISEIGKQQVDVAKQHTATVTACLNAINAYAEWAPLPDLAKYGIIHGCAFLLSYADFRLHACDFFKLVSQRKRPADATSELDSAMTNIFQVLINVSREFLCRSASNPGVIIESDYEFAEYICESMASLGSANLQCISADSSMLTQYLQQMLGYFQHFKFALHYHALLFWLALTRELMSKPKVTTQTTGEVSAPDTSGQVDNDKRKILSSISDEILCAILDAAFQRMLKREKVIAGSTLSLGSLELWSDDFEDKGDFGQYRARLLEMVKLIASSKPLIASARISERIITIIQSLLVSQKPAQDLAVMESLHVALENVVSAVFDGSNEFAGGSNEAHLVLRGRFEGLLQQLLSLKWTEPALIEILAHYLEAMGPFLKYFPDAVGSVINKLFELFNSLPFVVKDPATSSSRHARLQICTSFIRIAKAADKSILPHMKGIADTMAYLQREGRLLRGEHNLLGEAFLVMASSGGIQQQQEALVWLLEPLSQQWMQPEWQNNYLSDPHGLVRLCSETRFMWSLFHTVTFFEKALKTSGKRKGNSNLQHNSIDSPFVHPMASHLTWMLPPLLKLLRAIHSLWSPSVYQVLPVEIKAAMSMTDIERNSLLGESNLKTSKGVSSFADGYVDISKEGCAEPNESDIRNWLKGIRDSGYNVLGLSTTIGDAFFKSFDVSTVAVALMENIQSMEFRHTRQLIHSVIIYLVKFCPSEMWEVWIESLLHPLFTHCQQAISQSWSCLLHEGRAKVPDIQDLNASSNLKVEVMEEKILRDLTRELCALLSSIASPGLNSGLPLLEQYGHVGRVDVSALKSLETFRHSSMVSFVLSRQSLALPALQISLNVFTWTDGEATTKICSFCGVVILLSVVSNNVELRAFVSKDLFSSVIRGLALESNAINNADLVNLCREIYVHLCDRDPAPRQVLLSLPCITPKDLRAFEDAISKTFSPKEQKQHMRSLLLVASGNNLKALVVQKSVNVITNVSTARSRNMSNNSHARADDGGSIGLASILQ